MEPTIFYKQVAEQAVARPDAPALLFPNKLTLSYGQLVEQLDQAMLWLNRFGIGRNDRVAVVLPNGPEMASIYLAVSAVCTCAPLNPAYSVAQFDFYLTDLRARALILPRDADSPARIAATRLGIPLIELEAHPDWAGMFTLSSTKRFDESVTAPALAGLDDVALVLHTSGTTSRPKIVPLTQRNIFYSVRNIASTYELTPADRCLNMMPLFHIHGLMGALSASLASGASIICASGLRADHVLDWLIDFSASWYSAVPTMHQAVLEQARKFPEKTARIRLRFIRSSSSSLPPAVAEGLEKALNAPVLEAYGMTEATHQMSSNPLPPRPRKFGSVGLPTGTTRIAILDEAGQELPTGSAGEISICGENVMCGYENNPQANASAFAGGWLRTGDLGYFDEDGYLFIRGRSKEMINRGGEKITPREIDDVLLQHPAIRQAVAFAAPHPTLGEDVAAAVVLREGHTLTARELRLFASLHLVEFKVPRQVVFLSEIPKGPTGKIQRIGLAEKLKSELEAAKTEASLRADDSAQISPAAAEILQMWKEILGIETMSIDDDFLGLGGDSIRAVQFLARLNERFGLSITMRDLFDVPTVRDIVSLVEKSS